MPVPKGGTAMLSLASAAPISPSATASPSGPIRRIASGDTGSLNVSRSEAGACAITAPSAGSAFTNAACANAADACRMSASAMAPANAAATIRRTRARYRLGKSFSPGAGSG